MPAPIGNKYAEKWTREATLEKLRELDSAVDATVYIGEGLAVIGLYHEWFSYVADKFKDDAEVFHIIKNIVQKYESRLVKKTLLGDYNPTMAIFTLKNKHEWKDKSEVDNTTNLSINWQEEKTYETKPEADESH